MQARTLQRIINDLEDFTGQSKVPKGIKPTTRSLVRLGFNNSCTAGYSLRPRMHMASHTLDLMDMYINKSNFHGTLDAVLECPEIQTQLSLPHIEDIPNEERLQRATRLRKAAKTARRAAEGGA